MMMRVVVGLAQQHEVGGHEIGDHGGAVGGVAVPRRPPLGRRRRPGACHGQWDAQCEGAQKE